MRNARIGMLALAAVLAGCSGMKTVEKDVADLKSQMSKLQGELQSAHATADVAAGTAQTASQEASNAKSSADQAFAATQSSQAYCTAVNEKVDRAFRHSASR